MNRRQRVILNVALALAAGLMAWRLGADWQRANLRYEALSRSAERSPAMLPPVPRRQPVAVNEIVAKNLFFADRNNELPQPEPVRRGPPPPVPTVLGTMKLGDAFEALMSEGDAATSGVRRVKQGEQVGSYRVVEILAEKVAVEYEGQRTMLDVYQSARSVRQQQRGRTASANPRTPAAPAAPTTGGQTPPAPARPQANQPDAARGQGMEDPERPGYRIFIEGNRKRVERNGPFGPEAWYEPLEQ